MTERPRVTTQLFVRLSTAAILLSLMVGAAQAQQSRPTAPTIKDPKFETLEKQNREGTLRSAELGAAVGKADEQRIQAAIEQIKEDFKRLQIIRNEMAHNLLAGKPLDYKVVSGEGEETNKRAARLKGYLAPTISAGREEGEKKLVQFDVTEIKGAMVRLCHLIDSFVENPVIKNPGANDTEQFKKAMNDLLDVIDLSGDIKRSADKLHQSI
jgi:hypothetical protein